ncbi:endonuclease III [bacterium]|nr:endonuclease III [bacterium]
MPRESIQKKKLRAERIRLELLRLYPEATCSLDFVDPYQLMVSTVLSAQCTDERVNLVTPALFDAAPDAAALAKMPVKRLEILIHSTGFYRNKAKNLKAAAKDLVTKHAGKVPGSMEELTALAGGGRKTANVILGNAFDVPGFPVDTHVGRLSRRLALSKHEDPEKVEKDLCAIFPSESWTLLSHQLIFHGRAICPSRKPRCEECTLADDCPSKL